MKNQFVERIRTECGILTDEIGRGHGNRINAGKIHVSGKDYIGVIIRDLAVDPQKFGNTKAVNMLVLVPENYPCIPPLGIYLNQPYSVQSEHFVGRGYHGAPTLEKQGWYWFCHSFGGFTERQTMASWHPDADPRKGHNLATVVSAARIVMNQ